jgi:hypothetical protein
LRDQLAAENTSCGAITLNWDAGSDAGSYDIYVLNNDRSLNGRLAPDRLITNIAGTQTTLNDLPAGGWKW